MSFISNELYTCQIVFSKRFLLKIKNVLFPTNVCQCVLVSFLTNQLFNQRFDPVKVVFHHWFHMKMRNYQWFDSPFTLFFLVFFNTFIEKFIQNILNWTSDYYSSFYTNTCVCVRMYAFVCEKNEENIDGLIKHKSFLHHVSNSFFIFSIFFISISI